MSTLRDQLLPLIDQVRQLPDDLGFRRYAVTVRTRTWAGERVGLPVGSSPVFSDLVLTPPPRVRQVSQKEVDDSGGRYQLGDYAITAITPAYYDAAGTQLGGYNQAQLKPEPRGNTDLVYLLTLADDGTQSEAVLVGDRFEKNFRLELVVRLKAPPTRT